VAAGVPDNRSTRAVDKFLAALDDQRLMRELPLAPLTADELARVRSLEPRLREAVGTLDALGLPDSIQHDDLHAWNVCVREGAYRFIDWGDSCVGHPLGSLGVPLWHVPDDTGRARARVRDAYLEPWTRLAARHELAAACDAAVLVAHMTGVLKWALLHAHLAERGGYEDVIPKRLRELLTDTCA
jgi:Ser/Thr protein kinase RdoA (MazF antagonist)